MELTHVIPILPSAGIHGVNGIGIAYPGPLASSDADAYASWVVVVVVCVGRGVGGGGGIHGTHHG
jgi:hypothetical protein